jgi:hypothetical protein
MTTFLRQFATTRRRSAPAFVLATLLIASAVPAARAQKPESGAISVPLRTIWGDPGDIRARDLYWGPGGEKHQPKGPVTFVKEDREGHNPKFDVEDASGKKWRLKVGPEAQPEVVASRLLWAVGFSANENYFVRDIEVKQLPTQLSRGAEFVKDSHAKNARLQRHPPHLKRTGDWSWRHNPFLNTREFNGLRVMMALVSNWDLKDQNNAILQDDASPPTQVYETSDVGSTFGASGRGYTDAGSKNNLKKYRKAKFVSKTSPDYVEFAFPKRAPLLFAVFAPPFFFHTLQDRWIGRHIPREDAKWIAGLLGRLSHDQIRDAFRAGGYAPEQVEGFASVLEARIAELQRL